MSPPTDHVRRSGGGELKITAFHVSPHCRLMELYTRQPPPHLAWLRSVSVPVLAPSWSWIPSPPGPAPVHQCARHQSPGTWLVARCSARLRISVRRYVVSRDDLSLA